MPTKTKKTTSVEKKTAPVIEEEQVMPDAENFITFRRSHFYSVLVVLAFGAGILVGYVLWGRGITTVATVPAQAPSLGPVAVEPSIPQPTPQPVIYKIETEGFPSIGPDDAPITIVEFSDYQCPYCYRWHIDVYDTLLTAYPDQIKFVYRNFPLSFHQNAFPSAEAALCAGDQKAYWEFHNVLFDNQALLNNQTGMVLDQENYNQFATDLGLDVTTFEECMISHTYQQSILDDISYAASLPNDSNGEAAVGGTPTFFVNGHRLGGAYPIEYFKQIIDVELANN